MKFSERSQLTKRPADWGYYLGVHDQHHADLHYSRRAELLEWLAGWRRGQQQFRITRATELQLLNYAALRRLRTTGTKVAIWP
jgi:hypothetical protein